MPHAALWVVQLGVKLEDKFYDFVFQCRTRLCGWCSSIKEVLFIWKFCCFNAARGFVCGAA